MRERNRAALIAAMLILGGVLFAQSESQSQKTEDNTQISQNIERPATVLAATRSDKELSDFSKNIEKGLMVQALEGKGPMTVFAPTNSAFAASAESEQQKFADSKKLQMVLQYHVVPGLALTQSDLLRMNGQKLVTVQGDELTVVVENNTVWVGSARLTGKETLTDNGVVHEVDDVLIPPLLLSRSAK